MSALRTRLRGILDDYVGQGIIGVSIAVSVPGDNDILLASGLADRVEGAAMTPDHPSESAATPRPSSPRRCCNWCKRARSI